MTPAETAFASELIAYWLSFVRAGDPSTHRLARSPAWPAYAPAAGVHRMVLTQGSVNVSASAVESIGQDERERCAFVASITGEQQN
jgi:hypothetical protein